MLGMWGVGKTSLVRQFVDSIYDEKYMTTLGVKVDKKVVEVEGAEVNLILWDVAGAEDHFDVPLHYIQGAVGYLLVVDGTRRESMEKALNLVKLVEGGIGKLPFVTLVNKSDLDWVVSEEEIADALSGLDTNWFPSSAKTGANVELAFKTLTERLVFV